MTIGRAIVLGGLGAGLVWAYRSGRLAPILAQLGLGQGAAPADQEDTAPGSSSWEPLPILGNGALTELNKWEAVLAANPGSLSTWAQQNRSWATAVMMTENKGLNVTARGSAGELGLFQVKPGTGAQLVAMGYNKFKATEADMLTAAGSIYFGTAYLEYLAGFGKGRDWTIKAYNGGPGFEGLGAAYIAAREAYLDAVERNWNSQYAQPGRLA